MAPRSTCAALLAIAACLCASGAPAELWQWTDDEGVVRYTPNAGRVPAARRGTMRRVEPGMALEEPAQAAVGPSAVFAPPEEAFEVDPFNAPEEVRSLQELSLPEAPATPPEPSRAMSAPEPAPVSAAAERTEPVSAAVSAAAEPTAPVSEAAPEPVRAEAEPELAAVEPPAQPAEPALDPATEPLEPPEPFAPPVPVAPEPPIPAQKAAAPEPAVAPPPTEKPDPYAAFASASRSGPPEPQLAADQRARREELLALIAADEAVLKDLISRPEDGMRLEQTPEFIEIAQRLPALQAELRAIDATGTETGEESGADDEPQPTEP